MSRKVAVGDDVNVSDVARGLRPDGLMARGTRPGGHRWLRTQRG